MDDPGKFGEDDHGIKQTSIGTYPETEARSEVVSSEILTLVEIAPLVGLIIVGKGGHIDHVDDAASELLFHKRPDRLVGRSFHSALPPGFGASIDAEVSSSSECLLRLIMNGRQLVLTVRRTPDMEGWTGLVQRYPGLIPDRISGFEVRFLPVASWGAWSSLTDREIEVAAWVGLGYSVRTIAQKLGRSVKTVENHRNSIGRKLGVSDRLDIGLLASEAGLRPEDAQLRRV